MKTKGNVGHWYFDKHFNKHINITRWVMIEGESLYVQSCQEVMISTFLSNINFIMGYVCSTIWCIWPSKMTSWTQIIDSHIFLDANVCWMLVMNLPWSLHNWMIMASTKLLDYDYRSLLVGLPWVTLTECAPHWQSPPLCPNHRIIL